MKKTKIKQFRGSSAVASIPSGAANSPVINSDRGGSHSQKNSPGILPPVKPFYLDDGTTFIGYHAAAPDHSSVQLCRDGFLLRLPLFPPSECRKLLEMTTSFSDWDALFDSVDRKSENQHLIFDLAKGFDDGVLYPLCTQVSERVLEPVLRAHFGLAGLRLHWAFLRRYTTDGRVEFPVHRDSSAATVNVLLSDPADFTGAELYLLDNEHKKADSMSEKQFKKSLPESVLRQRFAVPYVQGECCMHLGKRLHGVLPLLAGERFTLILMYLP
mmetsp:Transcript_76496/g.153581  ORF Transcript_76496/g.153581 Transcript_76496/m.153581 type:complete len:271 (-) Transcript_76496:385-1197(-)